MWEIKTKFRLKIERKLRTKLEGGGGKGEWGRKRGEKCELAKLNSG